MASGLLFEEVDDDGVGIQVHMPVTKLGQAYGLRLRQGRKQASMVNGFLGEEDQQIGIDFYRHPAPQGIEACGDEREGAAQVPEPD